MEFKTVLMICSIAAFVITMLRRIAKDDIVDLIGASVGAVLFILILIVSFLFENSSVLWALIFGFWACESESNMRGE
nr:MAG TPA: hypothetical protein [Bacteriophage sp.]